MKPKWAPTRHQWRSSASTSARRFFTYERSGCPQGLFLLREGLGRARRQRHLKSVQRVSDRRVIADDRAKFGFPSNLQLPS
jgi:hypothetical protein